MRQLIRFLFTAILAVGLMMTLAQSAHADSQVHVVQPGETLFRISLKYGVTVEALQAANGIVGTRIDAGQTLIIPDPNAPVAVPLPSSNSSGVHIVQPGETLFKISLKYNVNWLEIQAANGIVGTKIYSGQQLVIPNRNTVPVSTSVEAPAPQPQPAAQTSGATEHIVQRGETLFKIGLKYNINWMAIQAANGLAGTKIYTGQRLVIPSSSAGYSNLAPVTQSPEAAAPTGNGNKRFVVDLSDQMLYAYEGDTLVRSTLVSTGTWRYPTVTGTFSVYLRYVSANMRGIGYFLPDVPYVMYFYKSYGLHGTYWHNNFGTPMSHGCVNMPTSEAEWAYYWSDYGTTVIVQQ
jgi:LysM repeat protein